jgi:threonine aldolase
LIGEALVIITESLKEDFRYHIKQKGALLAKGRLLGIQFRELFRDNLFFELAEHANRMAGKIQDALIELGCPLLLHSPSNQLFPIMPNEVIAELAKNYSFEVQRKVDEDRSLIRLVTSWATKESAVEEFIAELSRLM